MAVLTGAFYGEGEYSIDEYAQIRLVERQLRLSWTASACPDADYYTVRYAPDTTDPFEEAVEVHRTTSFLQFQTEETECEIDDRRGKYFISCTDTSGNEGDPVEFLYEEKLDDDWQLRREIKGHPEWDGGYFFMNRVGQTLRISIPNDAGSATGFYESFSIVIFGDVGPVRFVSDPLITNNDRTTAVWQYADPSGINGSPTWTDINGRDVTVTLGDSAMFRLKVTTTDNSVECGIDFATLKIYQPKGSF